MTRDEIYKDIKDMFGIIPSFIKVVPDSSLELEWKLMKKVQFEDGPIPNKYRELIGLGISAATKCRYCVLFHAEAAKLNGATDEEIEDALHFAKSTAGWSAYINGLQIDYDQFKDETRQIVNYVRSHMSAGKELKCKDVGTDCDYVIHGNTEVEIIERAMEHARTQHHMMQIPPGMMEKAFAAIHDAKAA